MKAKNPFSKNAARLIAALILAGSALSPVRLPAEESGKGGATRLVPRNSIRTSAKIAALDSSSVRPACCPGCGGRWVTCVEKPAKTGAKPETKTYLRDECPACGTKLIIEGQGKAKTAKIVVVCARNHSSAASCCARNSGSKPASGVAN